MKMRNRIVALTLGVAMSAGCLSLFAGCRPKKQSLVIMTEELNELFNPFYSTAGTDMDVVGQTQISMLSTNEEGKIAYGDGEPTVVLDYKEVRNEASDTTDYFFVLKNGITFSDGVPLTMNDVLFNMYVYLDPAYSGSTTMYSTDIVGLQAYRTQSSTTVDGQDDALTLSANRMANTRAQELINLYQEIGRQPTGSYSASVETMENAIKSSNPSSGYKESIGVTDTEEAREQLLQDYRDTLSYFKEELTNDFKGAADAYTEDPYKTAPIYYNNQKVGEGFDEIISFMYMENYVELEYPQEAGQAPDKSRITKATLTYDYNRITTQEQAIKFVYDDHVVTRFNGILQYWATATTMKTQFVSKAKDVLLSKDKNKLTFKNVEGIVSLGHTAGTDTSINIKGKDYKVAREHDEKTGAPVNDEEYDVLRVRINGVDPKAIWNFAFTVAPHHYYSDPEAKLEITQKMQASNNAFDRERWKNVVVDIENDQFGVVWASFDFQKSVLQGNNEWGASKNKVPVGAGPYVATDRDDSDKPAANGFVNNGIVYYKRNDNFLLGAPKIEYMQYQVVRSSNAIGSLQSGQVHYVSPQFTKENGNLVRSTEFAEAGFNYVDSWQLGYGYIGINAGEVKSVYLRRAIMAAMDTTLALDYYTTGTVANIAWPMSVVSWAYPRTAAGLDPTDPTKNMDSNNGKSYTQFTSDEAAKTAIRGFMSQAGASTGDPRLKLTFTIAGASMTEHPTYAVFLKARKLLNECGWDVIIQADTNALTKLATGSLAVWAAAWGSTIDPDMYQVYHKNSTATSTLAWGYDDILTDKNTFSYENGILTTLSNVIDRARQTTNETVRTQLYREAMGYVLDLAVEMPVYQRKTLYAYNSNVIDVNTFPHDKNGKLIINSYSSPLSRIWEIDFVK